MYLFITLCVFYILLIILFVWWNKSLKKKQSYEHFDVSTEIEQKIPRIIIQSWKDTTIPEKYQNDVNSVKKYNPDYEYKLFTDDDIEKFLKEEYPEYWETYNDLPVFIQKIDFFRYIAIYHYGGFYLDLDITVFQPFDDLLDQQCIFPIDQHIFQGKCKRKRIKKYCEAKMDYLLGQYALAASPKHPFIKALIDGIHNNIEDVVERGKKDPTQLYVYQTTGPDYVTDVYLDYDNKENIHILKSPFDQYFGDYAKHNHFGTWKS